MSTYDEWTEEQLQHECDRRELKSQGEKASLVDRLRSYDVAAAQAQALNSPLRRLQQGAQEALNAAFFQAARSGTVEAVRKALAQGAHVNATGGAQGDSALGAACTRHDWDVAEAIVFELLMSQASWRIANNK
jgi:hypothetical protein